MLLCGIIDELTKSENVIISFFFCQATDARINNATAVLQGLLYLLVRQQPTLTSHLRERLDDTNENPFSGANAWWVLTGIFAKILQDPDLKNTCFIIDALDECTIDLPKLLQFIVSQSSASSRIKWIVSSRNWPSIEADLDGTTQQIRLCLELNETSISTAVANYIDHKVNILAKRNKYSNDLRDEVLRYLSSNADNTFLWVALVCQELHRVNMRNVRRKLREFSPSLEGLYGRMISQIQDSDDVELYKNILGVVSIVKRPITLVDLASLIDVDRDRDLDAYLSLADAVGECGSFLTLREDTILFVHQSAKDYLVKHARNSIFPGGCVREQQRRVVLQSLDILDKVLRRNVYDLPNLDCLVDEISVPDIDPLAPILYISIYWIDHLCETGSGHHIELLCSNGRVDAFLRKHFLHWLEALSLTETLSKGTLAIIKLNDLLAKIPMDSQLPALVHDAYRFLLSWMKIIEDYPLQVYISALVFSPARSLIREVFHKEIDWIEIRPDISINWGADIQTIRGHSDIVSSVVLSTDSALIASGSEDKTIKIWDANTGACLRTLNGHDDSVSSVAFLYDGRIASGSLDQSIKIWDINSGTCLKTLYGHDGAVNSIAFSKDVAILASGSVDGALKIWDISGDDNPKTLLSHSGPVNTVAFSNDGTLLASGSDDETIKIWDTGTDGCLKTLRNHEKKVNSVAFSNDLTQLVSGSDDGAIVIWDISTGSSLKKLRHPARIHSGPVESVAFLNDRQVISGSHFATTFGAIKIWDTNSGACLQVFYGHDGTVGSIAVSNTGRIISGSSDDTIKIWDTNIGISSEAPYEMGSWVTSIALSHDGRVVTGSIVGRLIVWDTTGALLETLDDHLGWVTSVAFSSDGRIASASDDSTIKIWENNGVGFRNIFTHHCTEQIDDIAFHDDDKKIIANNGNILFDLPPPSNGVVSMPGSKKSQRFSYGLDDDWITWNGQNIILIPLDYQPRCSAVGMDIIAMGCMQKRMIRFKFLAEPPLKRFNR
ncbi:Beta-TrCP [Arthrobotrys entomopaga]|nr:Beta-TrCP [Arthrobotrys entomopaga]